MLAVKSRNESENSFRRLTVQVSRRLIGEQQLGPGDECSSQRHALLFTAGKFPGTVVRALLQSDLAQPAHRFGFDLLPGFALS